MSALTIHDAALLACVPLGTARGWVRRGLLTPVAYTLGTRGHVVPTYDARAVLEVERETRRADPNQKRAKRLQQGLR